MRKSNNLISASLLMSTLVFLVGTSAVQAAMPVFAATAAAPGIDNNGMNEKANQLANQVHSEIAKHPDWVGMISWSGTNATIDYLGPSDTNPHNGGKAAYLAPAVTVQSGSAPNMLTGSSDTKAYKERMAFTQKYSTSNTVDYRQVLNAMNSQNNRWLQVGIVYDSTGSFGSPAWRALYNSWWTTGTNERAITSAPLTTSASSMVYTYITADATFAGQYTLGFYDRVFNSGNAVVWTESGDTGHNINLGTINNGSFSFPSGSMAEEYSTTGSSKFNFGSQEFDLYFLKTSTSSETNSVTGFTVHSFTPCISASNVNSPSSTTYTYGGLFC